MTIKKIANLPSEKDVENFEMFRGLIASVYNEMKEFSKKKPDEPLNKFKVKTVNKILEQVKEILKNEATSQFLELLDDEALPSNSDAILIIGQFDTAMRQFRNKYYLRDGPIEYRWSTKENPIKD